MESCRTRQRTVVVDLRSLRVLGHTCTGTCPVSQCCCSCYEVSVTRREVENIAGMMPAAARYCPHLRSDAGFDNVFDEAEGNRFSLESQDNGLCVFAYRSRGRVRCSLHSAALDAGVPVRSVKPEACLLWPLALSEDDEPYLCVEEEAFSYPCNRRRRPIERDAICGEVLRIVRSVFGEKAAREVERAAADDRRHAKITVS